MLTSRRKRGEERRARHAASLPEYLRGWITGAGTGVPCPYTCRAKKTAARLSGGGEILAKTILRFFFYVDFYFGGYVAEDFYRDGIFAESLDGFFELELALVDLEILRGEGVGDVAGGYGAEELIVLAGLASEVQRDAVDDGGLLLRGI